MFSAFYLSSNEIARRQAGLVAFGVFAVFEAVLLFAQSAVPALGLATAVIGPALLLFLWRRHVVPNRRDVPKLDVAFYILILVLTARPLFVSLSGSQPHGLILGRLDAELHLIVTVVLLVSISFPAINDLQHLDEIRKPDHFPSIAFGKSRTIGSAAALLVLAAITSAFLFTSEGPIASACALLLSAAFGPFVFEFVYGYRSYIMRVFGTTLFLSSVLAILVQGLHIAPTASRTIGQLLTITALGWAVGFGVVLAHIWRNTDKNILVPGQNMAHTCYLATLSAGTVYVFVVRISPSVQLP